MIEPGSCWWRRDPSKRTYRGRVTILTVLDWAPRARGGASGADRLLRTRSRGGNLGYIHPNYLTEQYEQVPPECQDPTAIGEHAPPVER